MDDANLALVRLAERHDEPVLWLMLTFAASMGDGGPSRINEAKTDPYLRTYVDAWGQDPNDLGLVAIDLNGKPIGAAWVRRNFEESDLHAGGSFEPELSIGVLPEYRGKGVGKRLLEALLKACEPRFASVLLSVREENPAVRLYLRTGFKEVERRKNRVGGFSLVMRYKLSRPMAG